MSDHDVLIVGAGPVGLLLACLLAQEGVDVVVCERREGQDPRTRAIGIHRPGLDALDAAGIGESVRGEALNLEGGEVRSRGRTLAALDFGADRPVLILPQPRTGALLRARLEALTRDALRPGWSVRSLHDGPDLVRAVVDSVGGERRIAARTVVVADGVHSALRAEAGVRWRRRPGRATYAMVDVDDPAPALRAVLHCEAAGLVESFPLPGGRRRWVVRQQRDARLDGPAAFEAAVEARTGIRLGLGPEVRPAVFAATQHMASAQNRGRVVLLGDAAHEVSPIGGQGMNLGWADAVRLSAALIRDLPGQPRLDGYAAQVRRTARIAQRRSAFYMAMGAPASPVTLAARELLIRALGSAPLRERTSGLITMRGI